MPRIAAQAASSAAPIDAPTAIFGLNFDSVSDSFEQGLSCTVNRTDTPESSVFCSIINLISIIFFYFYYLIFLFLIMNLILL